MGKYLTRFVVVFVSIYLIIAYLLAMRGIDILTGNHVLFFELLTVVYTYSEGKFHCACLRYTMIGVFIAECLTRLDNTYDFLTVEAHNLIPPAFIALGVIVSTIQSIIHFYKVSKNVRRYKNIAH